MIMAANQPYFVPYIGYWQLINAADVFIIGDDYTYIKGGWINRNRIMENGMVKFFNIELAHVSSSKNINELFLSDAFKKEEKLKKLRNAYRKAPHFDAGYALMEQVFSCDEKNLAVFLEHSIRCICDYLGITTKIIRSSDIPGNSEFKREYRIFDQCRFLGADTYINAIGGQKLYDYQQFHDHGIKLGFIQTEDIRYPQFWYDFEPGLSIIDVIMFNSKEEIRNMLERYKVLWAQEQASCEDGNG